MKDWSIPQIILVTLKIKPLDKCNLLEHSLVEFKSYFFGEVRSESKNV